MKTLSNKLKENPLQFILIAALFFVLLVESVVFMVMASQGIQFSHPAAILYSLTISTILTLWVNYDSKVTGTLLGMDQSMYIFFGWPIMFPIYVLNSRGFRKGGLLLLVFLGIAFIILIAAMIITMVIILGIAFFSFHN